MAKSAKTLAVSVFWGQGDQSGAGAILGLVSCVLRLLPFHPFPAILWKVGVSVLLHVWLSFAHDAPNAPVLHRLRWHILYLRNARTSPVAFRNSCDFVLRTYTQGPIKHIAIRTGVTFELSLFVTLFLKGKVVCLSSTSFPPRSPVRLSISIVAVALACTCAAL